MKMRARTSMFREQRLAPGIEWARETFRPVFVWPDGVQPRVLDLSGASFTPAADASPWTVGKYDEKRGIYAASNSELYAVERNIHVGVDLGGPVGHPVFLPCAGEVAFQGYNPAVGDYGHCVVTRHVIQGQTLWLLFGHLDAKSVHHAVGVPLEAGYTVGWLGSEAENGKWPPHLHFQLSFREPTTHDLPGVVTEADREKALKEFPDPRLILGPIY